MSASNRKTIYLNDATAAHVDDAVQRFGLHTSEFFSKAAESYIDKLESQSVTARIDAVLEQLGGQDSSNTVAAEAGRRAIAQMDDEDW